MSPSPLDQTKESKPWFQGYRSSHQTQACLLTFGEFSFRSNSALLWLQANLKDKVSRLSASHSHVASCMADSRVGSPKGWHIKKKKAERGKEDITPRKHKLTNACHPNNPLTRGKGQSTQRLMKLEGHSVEHIPLPHNAWSTRTYLVQHIFEILCYISV